jgi:SET family sugar efflux transporter-like MFS transporter
MGSFTLITCRDCRRHRTSLATAQVFRYASAGAKMSRTRTPLTLPIALSLFFTGITYASTLNYGAIVGIDTLGISNGAYSVILTISSLAGAAASVALGYISDRIPDRRVLVIGTALMGALAFGMIYLFHNQVAFIIAVCVVMPFGGALFSQSFSYARSYYNDRAPERAEFMVTIQRTIFSVAWVIVPPIVGWLAAVTTVFNAYGVAALAYLVCAAIFGLLLRVPEARVGVAPRAAGQAAAPLAKARMEPAIFGGIVGVTLIFTAVQIRTVTIPLLITNTLEGSYADLGVFAGLAALLELPFMVAWGYALRWLSKHFIIICGAVLYAVYLVLIARAGSVTEVLWLQLLNGPATAALLTMPIAYLQDAIKGRVGLSTSLLDVSHVVAALATAGLFGVLTGTVQNYPLMMMVAAGISLGGALTLFAAHWLLAPRKAIS